MQPVPEFIAMQPKPKKPDNVNPRAWQYYFEDLACWMAMKADVDRYGIQPNEER